ncbi:FecR domain-containing protein [Herbaspirillum rhizosphaerae]|uniref:FecR domain-containing protein n=1 Tax=Herbaspirillum rhizosphaerae TaxID=346179 RepID=A0ABW8Z9R3_9BURK
MSVGTTMTLHSAAGTACATHAPDSSSASTDSITEQAAQWIVQLSADDAGEREAAQRGFEVWKKADARHAAMAERLLDFIGKVRHMRGNGNDGGNNSNSKARPARAALNAVFASRTQKDVQCTTGTRRSRAKRVTSALFFALCVSVPAWVVTKIYPPHYLMADMRSATGKWETRVLEDGTRITLNSASAVNLHYDAKRRALELVQGEILIDVAKDPGRPFVVETDQGSIRALGTRFVVSREADATILSMLESRVEVRSAKHAAEEEPTIVSAGQRIRMTAEGIGTIEQIDARSVADAWKFHQLVVQGQSLPDVLDALDRYRPGAISYDRAALEGIKVSAVLPLDDTGRALQLLGNSFPALRIRMLSPYLVRVDATHTAVQP